MVVPRELPEDSLPTFVPFTHDASRLILQVTYELQTIFQVCIHCIWLSMSSGLEIKICVHVICV